MKVKQTILLIVMLCAITGLVIYKQIVKNGTGSTGIATKGMPGLIELGSKTCNACKEMAPIIEDLKIELAGKVTVTFIDIYAKGNEKAADMHQLTMIPTQLFIDKEGNEVDRHVGKISKMEIMQILEEHKML